jgi:hypothetical protein
MSSVINTVDLSNPVLPAEVGRASPTSFDLANSLATSAAEINDPYGFAAQQGLDLGLVRPDHCSGGLRLMPDVRLKSFARHGT